MDVKKCNLCGSSDFELIHKRHDFEVITNKESFKIDVNNIICKNCGLVFQSSIMGKENLEKFYSNQYREDESKGAAIRKNQKDYISKFINKDRGNILDIGSYEGVFLSFFKEEGWSCIGVEPSHDAAEICRKKYDIKVYEAMFEDVNFDDKMFDVITIREVLEHLDNPMNTIKLMKNYLKDDGIIFIEVPDINKFDYLNIADAYNFQHLYHFSMNVMKNYLFACGLEIIDVGTETKSAWMRFVCRKGKKQEIISDYKNTKNIVLDYTIKRKENLDCLKNFLNGKNKQWIAENKRIFLYGAGSHTEQLLRYVVNKLEFNIVGLLDGNMEKEGKEIFGYNTYSPKEIKNLDIDVIIISSYAFQEEIYTFLKQFKENKVEVVKLYCEIKM